MHKRQRPPDTRYCYGAGCTWHGPIAEVSNTSKHSFWRRRDAPRMQGGISLPCCPICGGMLLEVDTEEKWWTDAAAFEAGTGSRASKPHPGYVAMLKWQKEQSKCYQGDTAVRQLRDEFEKATKIHVPLDSDPEAA